MNINIIIQIHVLTESISIMEIQILDIINIVAEVDTETIIEEKSGGINFIIIGNCFFEEILQYLLN